MFNTMFSSLDKNKTPPSSDINKISSFIFCKWLAGNINSISIANEINKYYDIPVENQYFLVKHSIAGKVRSVKYVKSDKLDDERLLTLCKHFKINKLKALEYMDLISEEELKYILELYENKNKGIK